jgi:putative oxidoreductase
VVEFGGGLLLLLGLCTRLAAAPLAIVMIVAIRTALWDRVDSLEGLLGLEEFSYLAIFLWLAISGPGAISVDRVLQEWNRSLED